MIIPRHSAATKNNKMSTVISLPSNDATGVFVWLGLLFIIGIISTIIYEFTRKSLKLKHIFYTRLLGENGLNVDLPRKYFEWIWVVYHTRESTILDQVGVDGLMYLRYLLMSFYLFTTIGIVLCIILIPLNYYASEQVYWLNNLGKLQHYNFKYDL
jgi:Late exocytosis, associated with Golgi transport